MKKVLRKSLVTILVLATIMSTLAMFGFSSSAAVEDEADTATVVSANDEELILDTRDDQHSEFILTDLVPNVPYRYNIYFRNEGRRIIQTFGAGTGNQSCGFRLYTSNGTSVAAQMSTGSMTGYNESNNFITAEFSGTEDYYILQVQTFATNVDVRLAITYTDGFYEFPTLAQPKPNYNHILLVNPGENSSVLSHTFMYASDPAKVFLCESSDDTTIRITGGGNAIVRIIDPRSNAILDYDNYIGEPVIEFSADAEVPYYIAFYPIPGGIEIGLTITLTIEFI